MSHSYFIVQKCGEHLGLLASNGCPFTLGGSHRGIDEDLVISKDDDLGHAFRKYELIYATARYVLRLDEKDKVSHESNKVYSANRVNRFFKIDDKTLFGMSYNQKMSLTDYEITEKIFLEEILNGDNEYVNTISEAMNVRLGERVKQEPTEVTLWISDTWCYRTDILDENKRKGRESRTITVPLEVGTDKLYDYISLITGLKYKHP